MPKSRTKQILVATILLVKTGYALWFYSTGIGLNLGDTAAYVEAASSEAFYERGGIGFAYVATLLYSNPVTRVCIELLTVVVMCRLILQMPSDRRAIFASAMLLLPTSLAFTTVASKELLVFLLLCLVFQARRWTALPAFVLVVALKPSFISLVLFPLAKRAGFLARYLGASFLVVLFAASFDDWERRWRWTSGSELNAQGQRLVLSAGGGSQRHC